MTDFSILLYFLTTITLLGAELELFKRNRGIRKFRYFTIISSCIVLIIGMVVSVELQYQWLLFIFVSMSLCNAKTGIWHDEYPYYFYLSRILSIIAISVSYAII